MHREAVYKSWSRLGFHRGCGSASAEEATAVWVASAPLMASISARPSAWEKARNLISSPCSFSSACVWAEGAPAMGSPLA